MVKAPTFGFPALLLTKPKSGLLVLPIQMVALYGCCIDTIQTPRQAEIREGIDAPRLQQLADNPVGLFEASFYQ